MAWFCAGRVFCGPLLGPLTKSLWRGGSNCLCCICPCLKLCFWEWKDRLDEATLTPGVITGETFTPDFFGNTVKDLARLHKKMRPELRKKYGLHRGLGMEDLDVRWALNSITRDEITLFYRDLSTGLKWLPSVFVNTWCCCCKDLTYWPEKLQTGEAYEVSCCGPFFKPPTEVPCQHLPGQIGKGDELVILVSSPGDFHPWPGRGAPGNIHSTFQKYAEQSHDRIRFCPIQKGKSDEYGRDLVKPTTLDPTDPDVRDYYVALADKEYELDLWKAYWVANIKREMVNAKLNFERPVTKITLVGIVGGSYGAASERRELMKLGHLFDSRQIITDINNMWIRSTSCCISCGMKDAFFPGWNSGIAMFEVCIGRLLLCTPIKQTRVSVVFPLPTDFENYLTNPECKVLVDAFKSKRVPMDPPEAQEMIEGSMQRLPGLSARLDSQLAPPACNDISPPLSTTNSHLGSVSEPRSGKPRNWAGSPVKQAWGHPLKVTEPTAADGATKVEAFKAGADWAAKHKDAMRRQQIAIKLLQGSDVRSALAELGESNIS